IGYLAPLGSRRALSFWQITPAFVSFESLSGIKIFFRCALAPRKSSYAANLFLTPFQVPKYPRKLEALMN
ncbi:hypothetical protein, partial [Rubritalea profundi]|uniref:hypothetical protein n=1 Tax=Rubritalea profundi TaxID=1658618 RepID=UPI00197DF0DF